MLVPSCRLLIQAGGAPVEIGTLTLLDGLPDAGDGGPEAGGEPPEGAAGVVLGPTVNTEVIVVTNVVVLPGMLVPGTVENKVVPALVVPGMVENSVEGGITDVIVTTKEVVYTPGGIPAVLIDVAGTESGGEDVAPDPATLEDGGTLGELAAGPVGGLV